MALNTYELYQVLKIEFDFDGKQNIRQLILMQQILVFVSNAK